MDDRWDDGDDYEPFIGRWSTVVAERFVDSLHAAPGWRWLDVGCGTGALSARLLRTEPAHVTGIDPSAGFLTSASRRLGDAGNVTLQTGSGDALPCDDDEVDAAVSGLVLNFVPDPAGMIREMIRVTAAGGVVALYVWDYAGEMGVLRSFWDAAVAVDPSAAELDEGTRFPICHPEALAAVAGKAGLADAEVFAIDATARFADFADYWTPFLGGQGPAPTYVAQLADDTREQLRRRLEGTVAPDPNAPFSMPIRSWALRGTAPSAL